MCIRAHAAWREAFVTRGRIQEVLSNPLGGMENSLHLTARLSHAKKEIYGMPAKGWVVGLGTVKKRVCPC